MKSLFKSKSLLSKLLLIPVLICLSGCVYAVVGVVGGAALLGGYVVSPDTIEGFAESDFLTVWETTDEIVTIMGTILEKNEDDGTMIAKVSGSKVTITITTIDENTVKLNVKARKAGIIPKIVVAQDVFVKVMSHITL